MGEGNRRTAVEGVTTKPTKPRRHPALRARGPFIRRTGADRPRAHLKAEPWVPRIKRGMTVLVIGRAGEHPDRLEVGAILKSFGGCSVLGGPGWSRAALRAAAPRRRSAPSLSNPARPAIVSP